MTYRAIVQGFRINVHSQPHIMLHTNGRAHKKYCPRLSLAAFRLLEIKMKKLIVAATLSASIPIASAETIATFDLTRNADFIRLTDNNPAAHTGYQVTDEGTNIFPVKVPGMRDGWFSDGEGSLFYTEVTGDFMVETAATVFRLDGEEGMPSAEFTSAGLMVKKPNDVWGESAWLMYNIGHQRGSWAREMKVTHPSVDAKMVLPGWNTLSLSTLKLSPAHQEDGLTKLRLARIGDEYRAYYQDEQGIWKQEVPDNVQETVGFGTEIAIEGFNEESLTPTNFGIGNVVHVGIITNSGTRVERSDGGGRFGYLHIERIKSFDEALQP